jgi:hypothetical protein
MSVSSPIATETVAEPRPPSRFGAVADTALRVIGGFLAVVAALLTAFLELMLAPLRVGGHLIGVAVVAAVLGNIALGWFAHATVGRKWAIALPAVAWLGLMVVASGRTSEGDLLLVGPQGGALVDRNSWVGFTMIFVGSIAYAAVAFRLILAVPPRSMIEASPKSL